jgi:hypothetical protein
MGIFHNEHSVRIGASEVAVTGQVARFAGFVA